MNYLLVEFLVPPKLLLASFLITFLTAEREAASSRRLRRRNNQRRPLNESKSYRPLEDDFSRFCRPETITQPQTDHVSDDDDG